MARKVIISSSRLILFSNLFKTINIFSGKLFRRDQLSVVVVNCGGCDTSAFVCKLLKCAGSEVRVDLMAKSFSFETAGVWRTINLIEVDSAKHDLWMSLNVDGCLLLFTPSSNHSFKQASEKLRKRKSQCNCDDLYNWQIWHRRPARQWVTPSSLCRRKRERFNTNICFCHHITVLLKHYADRIWLIGVANDPASSRRFSSSVSYNGFALIFFSSEHHFPQNFLITPPMVEARGVAQSVGAHYTEVVRDGKTERSPLAYNYLMTDMMSFIGERKVECMPMKITFEFDGKDTSEANLIVRKNVNALDFAPQ
ncbi:unnamed protein product [Dracunculus medinensis]|uniref:Uncharacterized protein n=1 Tax=Dracunculus medinensis TaxID=318479 RepID=A0A3P7PHZ1_DRAME|nr:unnamed protein product [Dracunculus medinensis]